MGLEGLPIKRLENTKEFKLKNIKNYQQLFSDIPHLRSIVSFIENVDGKNILDLGCGNGWASMYFARSGAYVSSCDISSKCVDVVIKYAESNGLQEKIHAKVMNAEDLKFEDDYFDVVFINEALHHCDIEKAGKEIYRVLKKNGKAVFIEDLAYHPVFKIYRLFTKSKHTLHEKPLTYEDVNKISTIFGGCEIKHYQLLNIFSENKFTKVLQGVDDFLLGKFTKLNRYCRIIVMFVSKCK